MARGRTLHILVRPRHIRIKYILENTVWLAVTDRLLGSAETLRQGEP